MTISKIYEDAAPLSGLSWGDQMLRVTLLGGERPHEVVSIAAMFFAACRNLNAGNAVKDVAQGRVDVATLGEPAHTIIQRA